MRTKLKLIQRRANSSSLRKLIANDYTKCIRFNFSYSTRKLSQFRGRWARPWNERERWWRGATKKKKQASRTFVPPTIAKRGSAKSVSFNLGQQVDRTKKDGRQSEVPWRHYISLYVHDLHSASSRARALPIDRIARISGSHSFIRQRWRTKFRGMPFMNHIRSRR